MTDGRDHPASRDVATILRRGLLALAGLGIAGTTIELVFLRHWTTTTAAIVWVGMAALGVAFIGLLRRPGPTALGAIRVLAAIAFLVSIAGVGFHVIENLAAGPLDRNYATTWDAMSVVEQWWTAITGGIGPAPALAPGALAEIALALMLATVGWQAKPLDH